MGRSDARATSPDRSLSDPPLWKFTKRLAAKQRQGPLIRRLNQVRELFPELAGTTIKVGVSQYALGKACREDMAIWLRSRNASCQIIGHELTHLVQGDGIPDTERACDLFTLARAPLLCDTAPVYLELPESIQDERGRILLRHRQRLFELAREAVERRRNGMRRYLSWFEKQVAAWGEEEGSPSAEVAQEPAPPPPALPSPSARAVGRPRQLQFEW